VPHMRKRSAADCSQRPVYWQGCGPDVPAGHRKKKQSKMAMLKAAAEFDLRLKIKRICGELPVGAISEMARYAGVSMNTMSSWLSSRSTPETLESANMACTYLQGLGYNIHPEHLWPKKFQLDPVVYEARLQQAPDSRARFNMVTAIAAYEPRAKRILESVAAGKTMRDISIREYVTYQAVSMAFKKIKKRVQAMCRLQEEYDLQPCQVCGCEPLLKIQQHYNKLQYRLVCTGCELGTTLYKNKAQAAIAWNNPKHRRGYE